MSVLRLILAGLKLILILPVSTKRFQVGPVSIGLLVALSMAADMAIELAYGYRIGDFRLHVLLIDVGNWAIESFLLALLIASTDRNAIGPVIAMVASVSLWTWALQALIIFGIYHLAVPLSGMIDPWLPYYGYWTAYGVAMTLLYVGVWQGLPLILGRRARVLTTAVLATLTVASLLLPTGSLLAGGSGFADDRSYFRYAVAAATGLAIDIGWLAPAAPPQDDDVGDISYSAEAVLGQQPELLERRLVLLEPERPRHRDLYLIGFAGYGWQHVFQREVEAVDTLFARRFDTFGRSLELINSSDTIDYTPLAGPHNLDVALSRVGKIMNKDEDVLFLFLTSHGGPGIFSVTMGDMPFRDLTPKQLRTMLDRSGIKNRVLVISACYSGSFIKDLANDDTLLITAARPDRTSFGCADERDWTYFGDAFFNHALRETTTFTAAFEIARRLVAEWEKKEGIKPSEPQISIGRHIEATLAGLPIAAASLTDNASRR